MSSHRNHQTDTSSSQPSRNSYRDEERRRGSRYRDTSREREREGRGEDGRVIDDERKSDRDDGKERERERHRERERDRDRNHDKDRERVKERDPRPRRDERRREGGEERTELDPRGLAKPGTEIGSKSTPLVMSIKGRSKASQPPPIPSSSSRPSAVTTKSSPSLSSITSLPTRPSTSSKPSFTRPPTRPTSAPSRPLKRPLENYVPEEETIRNDYALRYAVGGEWSGNWIKGANAGGHDEGEVCSEYPRLRRLLDLKRNLLDVYTHPPLFLNFLPFSPTFTMPNSPMVPQTQSPPTLSSSRLGVGESETKTTLSPLATPFSNSSLPVNPSLPPNPTIAQFSPPLSLTPSPYMQLTTLLQPHRFTSILITPPPHASWNHIQSLPIRLISADQSFVFLWVGRADSDGLERGRELLVKWGFRRCEDIIWVQTNRKKKGTDDLGNGMMVPMKEHCLVGIRGTVRRSTDQWLIHANVDTDVIVWDGPDENDPNPPNHPPQLHDVIENFCLGTRRLELFVPRGRVRKGWVGVGYEDVSTDSMDIVATTIQPSAPTTTNTFDSGTAVVELLEAQAEGMDISDSTSPKIAEVAEDFDSERYGMYLSRLRDGLGRYVLPHSDDIEALRPKTPPRSGERPPSGVGYASPTGELQPRHGPAMNSYDQQQRGGGGGYGNTTTNNYGPNMAMQGMNMMNNPMMNPFLANVQMMTLQQQINQNMALAQMQMMGNGQMGNGMGGAMGMDPSMGAGMGPAMGNTMGMNDMMSMMSGGGGGMPFGMMGMNPAAMMMGMGGMGMGMGSGSGQRQRGSYEPYDGQQRWQGSGEQGPWSPPRR